MNNILCVFPETRQAFEMDITSEATVFSEVVEIRQTLDRIIYELESICALDSTFASGPPDLDSVMLLSRRLAPNTIAPLFSRFNPEVGPLEALPARYRLPFPTIEDFKFSILNHRTEQPVNLAPKEISTVQETPVVEEPDEYDDDF
jgi:hypothetical protein